METCNSRQLDLSLTQDYWSESTVQRVNLLFEEEKKNHDEKNRGVYYLH